ncbi:unnamed protein product [Chrysodeixis includens]|uniref:DNA-3-methyladenine glycosylase I n=1 Tax=Chrysodeixis includens TaxID=689277 RepID=A0A9N8PYW3_CHRIL|nr:unnamed protein product [Chrysodeixis includens]
MRRVRTMAEEVVRCAWLTKDPIYIKYHDEEWGKPEYNSQRLFEMLCLEGQQAGLSWLTILKKREAYQRLFFEFDPYKIVKLEYSDVFENMIKDEPGVPGLVKHKRKIESILNNAKCYARMENEGEDFSKFIWSFVNHKPIVNRWETNDQIPSQTSISASLALSLKAKGFKYVGSTTCYAFMQACGLVNDHLTTCISYNKCS